MNKVATVGILLLLCTTSLARENSLPTPVPPRDLRKDLDVPPSIDGLLFHLTDLTQQIASQNAHLERILDALDGQEKCGKSDDRSIDEKEARS